MVSFSGIRKQASVYLSATFNLLFMILCLSILSSVSVGISDDRMSLLEFKRSVSDPHGMLQSWTNDSSSHCSWFGVSCDSDSRVTRLEIGGNFSLSCSCSLDSDLSLHGFGITRNCSEIKGKLVGKLSDAITNLKKLKILSLPFNELFGEIPTGIFGLENLQVLDLEGNSLGGNFSSYVFTRLRKLRVLNLGFNKLFGGFPSPFMNLRGLRILNLARNEISGVIPGFLYHFGKLRVVNLSFNRLVGFVPNISLGYECGYLEHLDLSANFLKGEIPHFFGKCSHLKTLLLSSNSFNGLIPNELGALKSLEVLDVSRNNLSGPLPENLGKCTNMSVLVLTSAWRARGEKSSGVPSGECNMPITSVLISEPLVHLVRGTQPATPPLPHNSSKGNGNNEQGLSLVYMMTIVSTAIATLCIAFFVIVCYLKKKKIIKRIDRSGAALSAPTPILFPETNNNVTMLNNIGVLLTYDTILHATHNFNRRNCIGSGGFGSTYKAEVATGETVAVKRLTAERQQGAPQFEAEVTILGRIQHPNLITLIGYYVSQVDMFLIYNYLPGGNLDQFIGERANRAFNWATLHKIALHIASALSYLHDTCCPRVLHRDIKPSNILLDNEYNAYLSDFGLSRILDISETHATTRVAGTYGYIAPEYALTGRVSDKADVYSYGTVLLELMSDKRALDPSFYGYENGFNIVSWANLMVHQGDTKDVFWEGLWKEGPRDKLLIILNMAISCTMELPSGRPTMREVVQKLQQLN